jgi:hypothetical protein
LLLGGDPCETAVLLPVAPADSATVLEASAVVEPPPLVPVKSYDSVIPLGAVICRTPLDPKKPTTASPARVVVTDGALIDLLRGI